jgi:hypothetical protein
MSGNIFRRCRSCTELGLFAGRCFYKYGGPDGPYATPVVQALSIQGFSSPFKAIKGYSSLFTGFWKKLFFWGGTAHSEHMHVARTLLWPMPAAGRVPRRPKPFQGLPSRSKAFSRKKRLFVFMHLPAPTFNVYHVPRGSTHSDLLAPIPAPSPDGDHSAPSVEALCLCVYMAGFAFIREIRVKIPWQTN